MSKEVVVQVYDSHSAFYFPKIQCIAIIVKKLVQLHSPTKFFLNICDDWKTFVW